MIPKEMSQPRNCLCRLVFTSQVLLRKSACEEMSTGRVAVLGGGAWGTALALHCARKGHDVLVWAREQEVVDGINIHHENVVFFKVCKVAQDIV